MLGIITIAQGDERYLKMAEMLALSLIKNHPTIQRAVISDTPQERFEGLYDIYIPINPSYGKGLSQKLFLDRYTPFDETLFIDADSLIVKPLHNLINLCRQHSFVVLGGQISTGNWYMDVDQMCTRFSLPSIPLFNGGLYYFKKNQLTQKIYDTARQMAENYTQVGFVKINGGINEEPLISVAMARYNIEAVDDSAAGMRTPIGITGPLKIDVLRQYCSFNKEGETSETAEPAIVHFSGAFADAFHYKRECVKLKLANRLPFVNIRIIAFTVNLIWNIPYAIMVFCKRIIKKTVRKERFDFRNALPVFSNY